MNSTPALVDIGLNLTHDSFDHDRATVVEAALAAGVAHMVITGSSIANTQAAITLVQSAPTRFRATAGVHPHHAADLTETERAVLLELMRAPEVAAAGECGLDYFRNLAPQADQERAFRMQLEMAVHCGKPVFLHQRDAHAAFVGILKDYLPRLPGGVAHCFTGDDHELRAYLDLGLCIGITGWICDERRGQHLRKLVRSIPLDRLMVETDAPYLLPRDLVPKPSHRRNEPRFLPHIVRTIAACRGEDLATVMTATTRNALRFFSFPIHES